MAILDLSGGSPVWGSYQTQAVDGGKRWHMLAQGDDMEACGRSVADLVQNLSHAWQTTFDAMVFHSSLYENRLLSSLEPDGYMSSGASSFDSDLTPLNIIRSMVDTVAARISKRRPSVDFLTIDGAWSDRRLGRKLGRLAGAMLQDLNGHRHLRQMFIDSAIWGIGMLRVDIDGQGGICIDRVLPHHVLVDPVDAYYNKPQEMHHVRSVNESQVRRLCIDALGPKKGMKVAREVLGIINDVPSVQRCTVIESWRLPSGPDEPGVRCLTLADGASGMASPGLTIVSEPWSSDRFPIITMQWSKDAVGPWASGLAEQLAEIQTRINQLMIKVNRSIDLTARPVVLVPRGSELAPQAIDSKIGSIIKYSGPNPPQWRTTDAVPPAAIQHIDRLIEKAYSITGVSLAQASAEKDPGITAAVAIRELSDIQSDRFSMIQLNYEDACGDLVHSMFDATARLLTQAQTDPSRLRVPGGDALKNLGIAPDDLSSARRRFRIQAHSVSSLPSTPAGLTQFITDLNEAGYRFPQDKLFDLLDIPEIEGYRRQVLAARDDVERFIERIIDDPSIDIHPDQTLDLNLAVELSLDALRRARAEDAPEATLDALQAFYEESLALLPPPPPPLPPQ